jgi:predicted nuclease of predicted toxin-antitoxin system
VRFLVDECTGPVVARWLEGEQHEVFSVYDSSRGMDDDAILRKACAERWIVITNDKDFGELVYREHRPHHGVVFLRLADERAANKIEVLRQLLITHADKLPDRFITVTETHVRVALAPPP